MISKNFVDDIHKQTWSLLCTQLNGFKYCYIIITNKHQIYASIQFVLLGQLIGPNHMLPLQVSMELGAMAMKGYSIFPQISNAGESPSNGLMSYPRHLLGVGLSPLQGCRRFILQS